MTKKEFLSREYARERKRVQSLVNRYRKKGFEFPENIIPAKPKRITEGSIRRLQKLSPTKVKTKSQLYTKQLHRQAKISKPSIEKPSIEKERVTPASTQESYTDSGYYESDSWFEQATPKELYNYSNDPYYLEPLEAGDRLQAVMEKQGYTDVSQMLNSELSDINLVKSDGGYIIDEETGVIVAKDTTKTDETVNAFIDDFAEATGADMSMFKDAGFDFDDIGSQSLFEDEEPTGIIDSQGFRANDGWANTVINNFIMTLNHFPKVAYPMLYPIIKDLEYSYDSIEQSREALASAIIDTMNDIGSLDRGVAYNGEYLNSFAQSLEQKYNARLDALIALDNALEEGQIIN